MALKLGALRLPFFGRRSAAQVDEAAEETKAPPPAPEAAESAAPRRRLLARSLPLIGRLSTGRQLQILTGALIVFLALDATIVAIDTRQSTFATIYVASVGKIRML